MKGLAPLAVDAHGCAVARLRCVTPKCRWVGWMALWHGGPCPRCGDVYAVYA